MLDGGTYESYRLDHREPLLGIELDPALIVDLDFSSALAFRRAQVVGFAGQRDCNRASRCRRAIPDARP